MSRSLKILTSSFQYIWLPIGGEFFDAIISIDSFSYYGSDDLYLNYLAHFLKPGRQIGIAGAGLSKEFESGVPEHLKVFWTQDCWGLHSAAWWRHHWERTGIVSVEVADRMENGWQVWLDWYQKGLNDGQVQVKALQADQGQYLTYIRAVARRSGETQLEVGDCWPDSLRSHPIEFSRQPLLLRNEAS